MSAETDTLFDLEPDEVAATPAASKHAASSSGTQSYVAHYVSPANETPTRGHFEFESAHRALSKGNLHDARLKMLELFGKDAVSWTIDEVRIKRRTDEVCGDQIELDFRAPKQPRKRRVSKKWL